MREREKEREKESSTDSWLLYLKFKKISSGTKEVTVVAQFYRFFFISFSFPLIVSSDCNEYFYDTHNYTQQ